MALGEQWPKSGGEDKKSDSGRASSGSPIDGLDHRADAVYWMLRHWEQAWADGDESALVAAERWLDDNKADSFRLYHGPDLTGKVLVIGWEKNSESSTS